MPVGSRLIRAREKRIPLDDFEFRERVPMMDHETWRRNLMSVIRDLAGSGYQERVWVRGAGPEVDSLSEAICRFFDGYDVDGFLGIGPRRDPFGGSASESQGVARCPGCLPQAGEGVRPPRDSAAEMA